jgi:hypothetical protein
LSETQSWDPARSFTETALSGVCLSLEQDAS